jgi:F-type H+-transporting ATPase subunit gamma
VAIGSERGFCGSFNVEVERRLRAELQRCRQPPRIVLVGSRLVQRAETLPGVALRLEGPAIVEEVQPALARLLDEVSAQPGTQRAFTLQGLGIVHHAPRGEGSEVRFYRPVERFRRQERTGSAPPRLMLAPEEFLAGLIEQYLDATLHDVFFSSLWMENHQRLAHLQAAVNRLEERIVQAGLRINVLRQEEITEEIEEIMLSAEALLRRGAPTP